MGNALCAAPRQVHRPKQLRPSGFKARPLLFAQQEIFKEPNPSFSLAYSSADMNTPSNEFFNGPGDPRPGARRWIFGNPALTYAYFINHAHYGIGSVMPKPVKRVSTHFGSGITSVGGRTPQFNILQPLGSLACNY